MPQSSDWLHRFPNVLGQRQRRIHTSPGLFFLSHSTKSNYGGVAGGVSSIRKLTLREDSRERSSLKYSYSMAVPMSFNKPPNLSVNTDRLERTTGSGLTF